MRAKTSFEVDTPTACPFTGCDDATCCADKPVDPPKKPPVATCRSTVAECEEARGKSWAWTCSDADLPLAAGCA